MNARLRNEFVGDEPDAAKKREEAFEAYNNKLAENPERAMQVLADLAANRTLTPDTFSEEFEEKVEDVLTKANNGQQFGFVDNEAMWGVIIPHESRRELSHRYQTLTEEEKNSDEGKAMARRRGILTLGIAAEIYSQSEGLVAA